jgi:non-canonical purine NTP pyrophosphatase (RdgB/HAM1 family)
MAKVTFITGNQNKADFLAKFLGYPVAHKKIDQDEIQSLDFKIVADNKARAAYEIIKSPVLVEDVGIKFKAFGKLPGTFTKQFYDEIGLENMCRLLDSFEDKSGFAEICYAYFDGQMIEFFEGKIAGTIANHPRGTGGFGFDPIFIPGGSNKTLAEMDEQETERFSLRTTTVYPALKKFLQDLDKK